MIPSSFLASQLGFSPLELRDQTVSVPHSLLLFLLENYLRHQPFHEDAYLRTNPDVADAVRTGRVPSAKDHYVTCGYWEERDGAGPPFHEGWYLHQNPDVAIAVQRGECPSGWAHYLRYGRSEGRCPCPEMAHLYATWRAVSSPTPHRPN